MNKVAVLYATREGHTRRIAEEIAATLRDAGFDAIGRNVAEWPEGARPDAFFGVVLAASVHLGRHEPEMVQFVKQHRAALGRMPVAFVSVTLSQAGAEREDATPDEHARFVADVRKVTEAFFAETGWHPRMVKPVAGALLYSKYRFPLRLLMRFIAMRAGGDTDTSHDHVYTDWNGLREFALAFAAELRGDPRAHREANGAGCG